MATIQDVQEAVSGVAKAVGPRIVGVTGGRSVGSGVIVGKDRILTNAHNLSGAHPHSGRMPRGTRHPRELTISFADGRTEAAEVVAADVENDLAVLEVSTGDAKPIDWANGSSSPNGSKVGIGAPVFALSNPGGRGLRVTFGLVSGTERAFSGPRGRQIGGGIEHTAPLLPGSSGGPIVDGEGRLLGINTHRLGEGFYLAIAADESLKKRTDALSRGDAPERAQLGVAIAPANVARRLRRAVGLPEADGLLVRGVREGSVGDKAGLKEGDLLVKGGGRDLKTVDDLFAALDAVDAGGSLEIAFLRGTEAQTVTAVFTHNKE
jgi:serine protease Do